MKELKKTPAQTQPWTQGTLFFAGQVQGHQPENKTGQAAQRGKRDGFHSHPGRQARYQP